jgi:hypothetical protein
MMKVAFRRSPLEDVDEVDEDAEGLAAAKLAATPLARWPSLQLPLRTHAILTPETSVR